MSQITEMFEFRWSNPDDDYLTKLCSKINLEKLVGECTTDFEKIQRVSSWVNNLWGHSGDNEPRKRDPISILEEVAQGKNFRCVEYAIVISGCLNALGIPSRISIEQFIRKY